MDFNNWYDVAKKLAGNLGEDLVHHVFERNNFFKDKTDGYIYVCLKNEFRNKKSTFHKLYTSTLEKTYNTERTGGYDTNLIYTILLQLENEGYTREVRVFKECYFISNEHQFSLKSKVDHKAIKKICTFVKNEIKKRYVLEDSEL